MGIRDWLDKRKRRRDTDAIEREKAMAVETDEERAITSCDIEGRAADQVTAERLGGKPPIDDDRL